jgi:diguanylate cyclase (GGDEF)-like protein
MGLLAIVFLVWMGQQRRIRRESNYARRLQEEVDSRTAEIAERNRDMERANRQLQEASVSDSLTGLGNRRCLHNALTVLENDPDARFILMVVDLDFLKPINDKYGHEAGDAALIQVAQILRRELRSSDMIVRWGGDEFVVLCPEADLSVASALAERVRSSVAKQIFRVGDGQVVRTSCSIGFAQVPFIPGHPQLIDWEESLSIADTALYEAKRTRNNWVGFGGTEKAAETPSLKAAIAADSAALEAEGLLVATRRPWDPGDTVDMLRIQARLVTH